MSIVSYSINIDFYGVTPDVKALKIAVVGSGISVTLFDIITLGDTLQVVFNSAPTAGDITILNGLVATAKYPVDVYSTYDVSDGAKALLWQGPIDIGAPRVLLAFNSVQSLVATTFLTPGGTGTESDCQIAINRSGTLRDFTTHVFTADASGTRSFTVRVNGVDTALVTNYAISGSGLQQSVATAAVVPGDLVSILYTGTGIVVGSTAAVSLNIS